ncbi:MAG TPA: right-handed parallel beta-helix repeat-containing protein [Candidatus Krumholzibacteria bacterium]|nr:right-handed parallel beta-helix repeat-containing protein [Candidatus Krumholzibacteria bacterium]
MLACLAMAGATADAATYHVAPNGSDTNSGTAAQPWRTLQKAASAVRAGDVVLVTDGTYAGMQITADGTASAPIVFRANGANVRVVTPNASTPDNINIEGGNYVTVEGFVVEDAPRIGIRAVTATGVRITGNRVARSGLTGILTGFTPAIEIAGNVVSESEQEHGIYVSNSAVAGDNPVIRDNECRDNAKNGIQLNGDCAAGGDGVISGALIERNVVHHNNWKGLSIISVQASMIRNNLIFENGLSAGAGGIHLADEPGCGRPSNNNCVVNNTIHEPRITGIRLSNGSTGNTIFNNLVVAVSASKAIVDEGSGNAIQTGSNLELGSVLGLFVGTGDYHLAGTSPAVDQAALDYQGLEAPPTDIDGTQRPQGALPDIGAYEYMLATGVAPVPSNGIRLHQNVPNPFNPSTRIAFDVPASEVVHLYVYNVAGLRVRTLIPGRPLAGHVVVEWDGRDDGGRALPSGVYFCQLVTRDAAVTRRMTLLK